MGFVYEEKLSRSPLVDFVWRTEHLNDGVYVASADACWDIIFTGHPNGKTTVLLCGPSLKTLQVPYSPGSIRIGICYKPWAIFEDISSANSADIKVHATELGTHTADA